MHANQFSQSRREPVNSIAHAIIYSVGRKKCTFLGGSLAGCPEGLCNFWVEQLTAALNCIIFGLSSPAGRNCAIFSVSNDRHICEILELSRLPEKIA